MKFVIVLSAIVACALANGYSGHSYVAAPIYSKPVYASTGHSTQYRQQDSAWNYKFGYNQQYGPSAWDSWGGGSSQNEQGDAWGNKHGEYSLNVGDGRKRTVSYTADKTGFRAHIKTNEPGIVSSNPADAPINGGHGDLGSYGSHVSSYSHAPVITHVGGYSTGDSYGSSYDGGY